MTVSQAYAILAQAYPEAIHPQTRQGMKVLNGKAKLRALATVIQSEADLAEAMAMIPDEQIRGIIRAGLVPMLAFTPKETSDASPK